MSVLSTSRMNVWTRALTMEHLSAALDRNGQFMFLAMEKLRLLLRWAADLDAAAEEVDSLWAALGADPLDRGKPETFEAFSKRIDEMFAELGKQA
jgi:hypothetical protein